MRYEIWWCSAECATKKILDWPAAPVEEVVWLDVVRAAGVPQLTEQPLQPRLQRVRGLDPDVLRLEVSADYHEGAHRRPLQENICIKYKNIYAICIHALLIK